MDVELNGYGEQKQVGRVKSTDIISSLKNSTKNKDICKVS